MARVAFDPFEALGLPRDASAHAIKSRYHVLARRYHPNRHQGSDEAKLALSEHFHQVHQAWTILKTADNRRRRAEILRLLELQDDMLNHYIDLINDERAEQQNATPNRSDVDGYISSDADEDLPNVGLGRRQTMLRRGGAHGAAHLNNNPPPKPPVTTAEASAKQVRLVIPTSGNSGTPKETDYFTLRRKKLEKLRRRELDAFLGYRDAMVAKFEAEEEAERQQELFEKAKWKREYFERAPKQTSERLRSFQTFIAAFSALSENAHKGRPRPTGSHGMSPVAGPSESGNTLRVPSRMLSRRKSVHRRSWSNDISGDQTSSDSDSDDKGHSGGRSSPPGQWMSQGRRGRERPFDQSRLYSHRTSLAPAPPDTRRDSRSPDGFKLVVRQPTVPKTAFAQDSSPDTRSGSSRSPSRDPRDRAMSFTVVSTSGAAEIFGLPRDERQRSPSPAGHHRSPSLTRSDHDAHNAASDLCRSIVPTTGVYRQQDIPTQHVHMLTLEEKEWMLESAPDAEVDPCILLQRLQRLDAAVAAKFMVKLNVTADFNFRLIYDHGQTPKQSGQTFIALSYRRRYTVEKHGGCYTLPLDADMFQAVWDERASETEGLWIDQICIDQKSTGETTVSMSAMDMVYRSARMIVVALDDVELEAHEGALLQKHMEDYAALVRVAPRQRFRQKQPPYLESHDELYRVIRKMLRSSWFKRAWCRHEMRLAKQHVFLVPCKRRGPADRRDVLRFTSKCIAHLLALSTEVPFEHEVESVKPALHAFFRDRSKMAAGDKQMRSHHGNFSTVVAEVFNMEAGGNPRIAKELMASDARKDKISIILNTLECGLALHQDLRRPDVLLEENTCYHDLLLVALAAHDPGVLCSVGAPLPVNHGATSWLYIPTVVDAGLNESKTLKRLPDQTDCFTCTNGAEHYIRLNLKFLRGRNAVHPHAPHDGDLLQLADKFIMVCQEQNWGRNRQRYLMGDRRAKYLFGDMRQIYVETLACVLHCGPEWMSDVCQRYSMSRWKVYLQGAFELLVALRNTMGQWPAHAWNDRAAGFIMDFVNFLVLRGLPLRQLSRPEAWRPLWMPTVDGGKVITFAPIGNRHLRTAVPTVLAHADYVHLARMWVVEPRNPADRVADSGDVSLVVDTDEWTLLGKSVVFSDEVSIEHMHDIRADFKQNQKVFGRVHSTTMDRRRDDGDDIWA